ncbi:hypothetical protein GDO86_003367 [Hymenochirus boettgeri]|uniref:Uncharacterized protein n=1 Tax=Hymenochirus boettgeri TaxID=247094 RepID=A0A8T2K4M9_9PIPI|nr:hypothetical protein GDO86_003367 [Hymenochirus boettgeri]
MLADMHLPTNLFYYDNLPNLQFHIFTDIKGHKYECFRADQCSELFQGSIFLKYARPMLILSSRIQWNETTFLCEEKIIRIKKKGKRRH